MAIFHLSVNLISRKAGRSSTAAAAYRAAERIEDERTGEIHDYRRRSGVESAELVLPSGVEWQPQRAEFWNAVETKNKRADAQVAREFVVALPAELDAGERRDLAVQFARVIADRYQVGADVAIHGPGRGDDRNHHAHILTTTNRVEISGRLGNKVRELDGIAASRAGEGPNAIEQLRSTWADLTNQALEKAGSPARVDHRTLADQGIDRAPTVHLGPASFGYERRTGEVSRKREDWEAWVGVSEQLRQAQLAGEQERRQIEGSILDLSTDLAAAKAEQLRRDRMSVAEIDREISRIAVPPVRDLVERDPAVVRLGQEVRELSHARDEALRNENTAKDQALRWRLDSPLRAQLHDRGLFRSKELDQFEQISVESARAREELTPRLADVRMAESTTRKALEERLTLEQAPIREQIAELDEIRASKAKQEQAERDQRDAERRIERARAEAPEQFKKMADRRQSRLFWRSDDEKALSPALREAIETYNATPFEARPEVLDRLMSAHRDQVIEFQKVRKELDRGR